MVLHSNSVFRRVIWIVLDSVGIGAMPDAADYGDAGSDTLGNIRPLAGTAPAGTPQRRVQTLHPGFRNAEAATSIPTPRLTSVSVSRFG
jgi:phosphopentomutase